MIALASFGLKQIPFSSQGSESGKYPFVPSGSFNELILEIEKIHDGDPSAIIVRGPQGSGKSATKYGLNDYFSKKGITVIQVNLSSLELRDLGWSIFDNAKEQKLIDENFLQEKGYQEGSDIERSKLEKIIIQTLEEITSKTKSCILIIDEFDVIAQPMFHDQAIQGNFLLNITNILNAINESKVINSNSFCTILAQTALSSEEFNNYISSLNKPLGTRLMKHLIDIKYDKDETKQIIYERLKAESIDVANLQKNKLFPFNDEIIDWLYDQINNLYQTQFMEQFRFMEQILREAIEKSLEGSLPEVSKNIVEEIFNDQKSRQGVQSPESSRMEKMSPETRNAIEASMINQDRNDSNILYLNGICMAMQLWEDREFSSVDKSQETPTIINDEIYISASEISVRTTGNSQSNLKKTFLWYTATKNTSQATSNSSSFTQADFKQINDWLEENKMAQLGCQRVLLTIFDDSPIMNETQVLAEYIKNVDKIFFRGVNFKRAVIAIGLANSEEERNMFRSDWDAHLHGICSTYLGTTLNDIGRDLVKEKHLNLIRYLYLNLIVNKEVRRDDLKDEKDWGRRSSLDRRSPSRENPGGRSGAGGPIER